MRDLHFRFVIFLIPLVLNPEGMVSAQKLKSIYYDSVSSKSELRVGARYTSDYYYMGRADSAQAPYLSPSVAYYHTSGFFARGSLSFLTTADDARIDLFTLSGGYDYYGRKFASGIYLSEYFFSDLSYNVQAEMSTYVNAYVGYDFSAFMVYGDVSLGFSESTDLFTGVEINRTFYALRNRLRITPAIYANAGTQKYYSEYYANRSRQTGAGMGGSQGHGHGGSGQQPPAPPDAEVLESEKFQILDYEADMQVSYKIQKVRLYVATTWTFPVNPSTIVTDQGTSKEELKNGFYWTTGVRISF